WASYCRRWSRRLARVPARAAGVSLSTSTCAPPSAARARQRRQEIGKRRVELRVFLDGGIGEAELTRRRAGGAQQVAHGNARRAGDRVVAGAAAVGEAGWIAAVRRQGQRSVHEAAERAQAVLLALGRGGDGGVEPHHLRGRAVLVDVLDTGQ